MRSPVVRPATPPAAGGARPRVGFAGVGWIGRHRMEAVVAADLLDVVAIADLSADNRTALTRDLPDVAALERFEDLLALDLDAVVVATPSALHAGQCIAALERGLSVFCQKPLARTALETQRVIDAAAAADRLLAVDLSYRWTQGLQKMRELIAGGEIGDVFAADLVFHNAYGPDKAWFLDPAQAGGGCLIDLGTHLVDAALWVLDWPKVDRVSGRLFKGGKEVNPETAVEDFAFGELDLSNGARARIACSWFLHAGRDAAIELSFYGARGSVSLQNVGGSFYDFQAELRRGTDAVVITSPPDQWGPRAIVDWAGRLASGERFDASLIHLVEVAQVLDRLYGRQS